ncbi:hypothetical protein RLIN73S_05002 [Rhodanobacter lindaniclasticus]
MVWRLRQRGEDTLQRRQETHVEHAVGLVQHQRFHGGEVQRALLQVVDQPAGVAMMMSTPRRSALTCGPMPTPPKMVVALTRMNLL